MNLCHFLTLKNQEMTHPKKINRDVNEALAAPRAGEDLNGKGSCIVLLNNSLVYC